MTPTVSSWIFIITLKTIMQYKDFKGGLKGYYRKKTPHVATCVVTIEIFEIFFSHQQKHDEAMCAIRKGHVILGKEFHHHQLPRHWRGTYTHIKVISQGIIKLSGHAPGYHDVHGPTITCNHLKQYDP